MHYILTCIAKTSNYFIYTTGVPDEWKSLKSGSRKEQTCKTHFPYLNSLQNTANWVVHVSKHTNSVRKTLNLSRSVYFYLDTRNIRGDHSIKQGHKNNQIIMLDGKLNWKETRRWKMATRKIKCIKNRAVLPSQALKPAEISRISPIQPLVQQQHQLHFQC